MMPVPNDLNIQQTDRKAALAAASELETVSEAVSRKAQGQVMRQNYRPTQPDPAGPSGTKAGPVVYGGAGRR